MAGWTGLEWLALAERELLLFAGIFFLIGALDELLVDGLWGWLRLSGRLPSLQFNRQDVRERRLSGTAAVFIPAWHEEQVLEHTIAHALQAWPHNDYRIYVGCYRNDMPTLESAMRGAIRVCGSWCWIAMVRQPRLTASTACIRPLKWMNGVPGNRCAWCCCTMPRIWSIRLPWA